MNAAVGQKPRLTTSAMIASIGSRAAADDAARFWPR